MSLRASDLPVLDPAPQEQPRLMVVDDEPTSAQSLQLYLQTQGYDVKIEYSGQRALNEIPNYRPHLLILDLIMPDLSGLDVIMKLRSDPLEAYLPVILITGHDQERKRLQSMISGADDYIAKPVNKLELLVRVQALLRTKTHLDRLWDENRALLKDLEARNKQLEKALRAVEAANLLKKNILNTVAHEMGTPMLQIKSAVHLLIEDISKSDPENMPAQFVVQAIGRLEGIVQNITDLVRSENLKSEPFMLADAADLAIRSIERSWHGKIAAGRMQQDIEADLPPVAGDRRAVARVFALLLDNALKFDPDGKPIKLTIKRQGKDRVYIAVSDKGIGIPEDKQERIFEEFYQVDSSTTRRFGGTGLGLALAKLLCDRMNTKILVESKVNKGSTFSFTLPIVDLD